MEVHSPPLYWVGWKQKSPRRTSNQPFLCLALWHWGYRRTHIQYAHTRAQKGGCGVFGLLWIQSMVELRLHSAGKSTVNKGRSLDKTLLRDCVCSDITRTLLDKPAVVSLHLDPKKDRAGWREWGRESQGSYRWNFFTAMFMFHLRTVHKVWILWFPQQWTVTKTLNHCLFMYSDLYLLFLHAFICLFRCI